MYETKPPPRPAPDILPGYALVGPAPRPVSTHAVNSHPPMCGQCGRHFAPGDRYTFAQKPATDGAPGHMGPASAVACRACLPFLTRRELRGALAVALPRWLRWAAPHLVR